MKVRVVWIGKTKDRNLAALVSDFASRIRHFLPLEIVELREAKTEENKRAEMEAAKLLESLGSGDRVVVLDPKGQPWTSEHMARFVGRHMREDPRALTFVIGGFAGLADSVKKRADVMWSLSPLTFTHDVCRLLVLEQIYRSLTVIRHFPYSK